MDGTDRKPAKSPKGQPPLRCNGIRIGERPTDRTTPPLVNAFGAWLDEQRSRDRSVVGARVEREPEALKLGADLDIVPGKEHGGFGRHDGFPPWEQDLRRAILVACGTRPIEDGTSRYAQNMGIPHARSDGGPGGRGRP